MFAVFFLVRFFNRFVVLQESELHLQTPAKCDVDLMRLIMDAFKRGDYAPALIWVSENAPQNMGLLFRLHRQHMLQLLTQSLWLPFLHAFSRLIFLIV